MDKSGWHIQPLGANDLVSDLLSGDSFDRFVEREADSLDLECFVRCLLAEESALRANFLVSTSIKNHRSKAHHDTRWEESTGTSIFSEAYTVKETKLTLHLGGNINRWWIAIKIGTHRWQSRGPG